MLVRGTAIGMPPKLPKVASPRDSSSLADGIRYRHYEHGFARGFRPD